MDILSLIEALALTASGHTAGHFKEASERGVPMSLHGSNEIYKEKVYPSKLPENKWGLPYYNPTKDNVTAISGAGFETQDKIKNALGSSEGDMASGIYKILYPLIQKNVPGSSTVQGGDIGSMERSSGNKYVKELITISALADLLKSGSKDKTSDLSFSTFGTGTPGLMFTKRF